MSKLVLPNGHVVGVASWSAPSTVTPSPMLAPTSGTWTAPAAFSYTPEPVDPIEAAVRAEVERESLARRRVAERKARVRRRKR